MNGPAVADLQRWSAEVARDPASPAFVPLARAFRRQGRREAALRICLRGLEHNPSHIEAHLLLGLLYLDGGDRERACDEWGIVLRLEPDNFDAHRGMGFVYLERGDYALARRHLERAAAVRPQEAAVREALSFLRERSPAPPPVPPPTAQARAQAKAAMAPRPAQPTAGQRDGGTAGLGVRGGTASPATPGAPGRAAQVGTPVSPSRSPAVPPSAVSAQAPVAPVTTDPTKLFDPLMADAPFIGALIIDRQGLVIAGSSRTGSGIEALGAVLAAAIDEAVRTAQHLALGGWRSILLEAAEAVVHMQPLSGDMALLMAVKREAPTGWVLRSAARAQLLARAFLGADA